MNVLLWEIPIQTEIHLLPYPGPKQERKNVVYLTGALGDEPKWVSYRAKACHSLLMLLSFCGRAGFPSVYFSFSNYQIILG